MQIDDDRTPAQRQTHTWGIVGTDRFLSGWGKAEGGKSYAVWACLPDDRREVLEWVESRSDMSRVREVSLEDYRPTGRGHCHVYVVDEDHPAIARKRALARERATDTDRRRNAQRA